MIYSICILKGARVPLNPLKGLSAHWGFSVWGLRLAEVLLFRLPKVQSLRIQILSLVEYSQNMIDPSLIPPGIQSLNTFNPEANP